ncbi:hypothetical protein ACVIW0_002171 [Bradyrhizobium sp. USDA 4454]
MRSPWRACAFWTAVWRNRATCGGNPIRQLIAGTHSFGYVKTATSRLPPRQHAMLTRWHPEANCKIWKLIGGFTVRLSAAKWEVCGVPSPSRGSKRSLSATLRPVSRSDYHRSSTARTAFTFHHHLTAAALSYQASYCRAEDIPIWIFEGSSCVSRSATRRSRSLRGSKFSASSNLRMPCHSRRRKLASCDA